MTLTVPRVPKLFISYSWESRDHQDKVLALADWLEANGVEVIFDQYEPNPTKAWPQWMEEGIRVSDFVICVCTAKYKSKIENKETAKSGLGLQWEGQLMYNTIAATIDNARKFQVVQFDGLSIGAIPIPLLGYNRHVITKFEDEDSGLEDLYRIVTNQPKATRPARGQLRELKPLDRLLVPRSGSSIDRPKIYGEFAGQERFGHVDINALPSDQKILPSRGEGTYIVRVVRSLIQLAQKTARNDDYYGAIRFALKVIELDSQNPAVSELLAEWYYQLKDYKKALHWQDKIVFKGVESLKSRYRRLLSSYFLGQIPDPSDHAKLLFQRTSCSTEDTLDYSNYLMKMGNYDEVISTIKSNSHWELDTDLQSSLSVGYWFLGRNSEAVEILEGLPKSEFSATHWINLGVGRAELNRFGLAIEAINKGLQLRRNYQFASYALSQIYALMGEAETSVSKLDELFLVDSVHLDRVEGERTFHLIRESDAFREFLSRLRAKKSNV